MYIFTYINIQKQLFKHTELHKHIHTSTYSDIYTEIYRRTHTYINIDTESQGYIHIDKNASVCTYTLTQHRYIHAQRYTGRQADRHTPPESTQPCPGIWGAKSGNSPSQVPRYPQSFDS